MTKIALLSTSLAVALLPAAPAPARALNFKGFVSSNGSGTTCNFLAPCSDFQTAHDATVSGGEIN